MSVPGGLQSHPLAPPNNSSVLDAVVLFHSEVQPGSVCTLKMLWIEGYPRPNRAPRRILLHRESCPPSWVRILDKSLKYQKRATEWREYCLEEMKEINVACLVRDKSGSISSGDLLSENSEFQRLVSHEPIQEDK